MRALLLTHGSRGDVQPFIALGQRMIEFGWYPLLAGPARFAGLAEASGVPFHCLDDTLLDLQALTPGGSPGPALAAVRRVLPSLRRMLDTAAAVDGQMDIVVHHPKALAGPHIAEKFNVPSVTTTLVPLAPPTSAFPIPMVPTRMVPRVLNHASWRLGAMIEAPYRSMIRKWRRDTLGLSAHPTPQPDLRLHPWSPALLPSPPDWPTSAAPIGFWFSSSSDWTPSADLAAFLNAGPPPIYIGFGSMVGRDPAGMTSIVADAVRRSGLRAVLATGWGGLDDIRADSNIMVVDDAPHDWLFPQVAAVVHHGGVGTVAAALRAGRPQVIRPFLADQPFWANRVHQLRLGPAPLRGHLNAQQLTAAIQDAVTNPNYLAQAETLARTVNTEDGTAVAIDRLAAFGRH